MTIHTAYCLRKSIIAQFSWPLSEISVFSRLEVVVPLSLTSSPKAYPLGGVVGVWDFVLFQRQKFIAEGRLVLYHVSGYSGAQWKQQPVCARTETTLV
ncbi:hypothetical protein BaRGS_00003431 [Batillaria attramentaria]|uniref:Uncharacterized protein n=1 Tax=Batillaria attramentaria TaxID=370345 RepID=A0ABD0M1S2_9CAEN